MEFRVLGPLEAEVGGQLLPLRGRRQRALLALLLLNANEVVPDDRLLEDLWGDEPPVERSSRTPSPRLAAPQGARRRRWRPADPPPRLRLSHRARPDRLAPLRAPGRRGSQAARRRLGRARGDDSAGGARALAGPRARGRRLRVLRTGRDRPARGASGDRRSRSRSMPISLSAGTQSSSASSSPWSPPSLCGSGFAGSSCSPSTARAGRPTPLSSTATPARDSSRSSGSSRDGRWPTSRPRFSARIPGSTRPRLRGSRATNRSRSRPRSASSSP